MKFNKIVSLTEKLKLCKDARLNHEGGLAFQPSSKLELYLKACTCLIEDRFYSKADQELELLRQVIARCDRNYVLKLAHFARTQMHLRSLPILLLAEASVMHSGNEFVEKALTKEASFSTNIQKSKICSLTKLL
ncbi:hypothetical protein COW36_06530 [bacterium (Candidatus Blackallbacteria) CG17_big_fil_post_rev_8_21_14_2_50_48_46]|uniref:TROVE domain-containing protein n=1 Tax=bacterium (Candidatus Blackallbacteria) CG17_big_fil_post_rev_8_21_14_2_50_48_46 TaxID=2014261 RepID=A0A2M7G7J8_9BACT|nr:MAG: hypothetical protein COW36_06530 [bacterium (Candidatus Blackallbacteria) CG17_big_fil_post_rev_8_21_14_2_50_48_46]